MRYKTLDTSFSDPMKSSTGFLRLSIFNETIAKPVSEASITIQHRETGKVINVLRSNNSGQTDKVDLNAPPLDFSLTEASDERPYSEYDAIISARGFSDVKIEGIQILPSVTALQDVYLKPVSIQAQDEKQKEDIILITPHTLWSKYPAKIPEDAVKPLPEESGFVVLDKPVIPEYIVVHIGSPSDNNATNYWIPYKDYIKNVASSEIYSTWPTSTIEANVLAIMSFTLNRVFTEWYRGKGKNFTITNTTAYDHYFVYGRNIYKEISDVVDNIFTNYVTKPNISQPLFTQYCDGKNSQCPGWMTQWGSKSLGDQGYSSTNILKYYYGQDIYLTGASKVTGVPSSYPGTALKVGSRGNDVKTIQSQLNVISKNYPAIGKISADGIFGEGTKQSVITFQKTFNLNPDGIVGSSTWYQISNVYVAVAKLAELN